jgi:hypothetical protein
VTKVLRGIAKLLVVCLAISAFASAPKAQSATAGTHQPGPAGSLYLQLGSVGLDPARVFRVRDASIDRAAIHITLDDGTIAFTKDVLGKTTGAFFVGDGEVLLSPPTDVERRSMSRFTGMAILEERFSSAYLRFNDDTAAELQPGLRAPEQAQEFVSRWDETARNLAQEDAMRLLSTFSELLPDEAAGNAIAQRQTDPEDRLLHGRLQGNTLGVFDVFFDSTADEQIEAGQIRTADNGKVYYDVWTSFSTKNAEPRRVLQKKIPETLPEQSESRQNRILVHSYVIDAHVRPPKELDADVKLQLDTEHGGSRFLIFELSRFLQVKSVEADGRPVEFIHNPSIEGSRLARSGNDLVAVILPTPAVKGLQINLRFVYRGDVLAEAGNGLLYVGERGTWYPNRGLSMADFDLTFHYPRGWTLVATGKPTPLSAAPISGKPSAVSGEEDEQVGRWVSERPIPVAGFNLGKYVRAEADAGTVSIEAYATAGVERDFPAGSPQPPPVDDAFHRRPAIPLPPLPPAADTPSPASNEGAVADFTAAAVRYYVDHFGPFPYSQLALTQLPGRESQGWPGLIFLSSYAFLNKQEQADIHMNAVGALLDQLIPAHETAHQWWGDLVTWSTYHDQWFSEGLANYSALMMLQDKNPTGFRLIMEKYREQLLEKNENEDPGPVTLGSRLLSSRFPQGYEAITYGRATWLFHMLRTMLQDGAELEKKNNSDGNADEPFVQALRQVRNRYAGKSITTRELFGVFAEDLPPNLCYEGKASLDWFLDGWVNGTSMPTLELKGVKFVTKGKATLVSGAIRQENAPADLVTSVPIYAVVRGRVPVLLGRVFADGVETSFRLSAPASTHKLLLDPYMTVLTAPKR